MKIQSVLFFATTSLFLGSALVAGDDECESQSTTDAFLCGLSFGAASSVCVCQDEDERRNLHLHEEIPLVVPISGFDSFDANCTTTTYIITATVGFHMAGFFTPIDYEQSTCPSFFIDSRFESSSGEGERVKAEKHISQLTLPENIDPILEQTIHVGQATLSKIKDAFEAAKVTNQEEQVFDGIANNCAYFLLFMMKELDLVFTQQMVDETVTHLMAFDNAIMNTMRSSKYYDLMLVHGATNLKPQMTRFVGFVVMNSGVSYESEGFDSFEKTTSSAEDISGLTGWFAMVSLTLALIAEVMIA